MSEILEKYELVFKSDKDITTVSSISPLLSFYINNSSITQATELYNQLKHAIKYKISQERDVILTKDFTVKAITDDVQIVYTGSESSLKLNETNLNIPIDDLLAVLQSWREFLYPFKVRDAEVKNGQGIIDIIKDDFATALVIEKAVAVVWPDFAGSIGEYYAVSRESYEKQKELTANLMQSLTDGSDEEVFKAITIFLDLFVNGQYRLLIGAVNIVSAEIVYDIKATHANAINENENFTYNINHYGYGKLILFTRSIYTVDQNRVKEFQEIINHGGRPKIVLLTNATDHHSYVIDGHHKLLAYQALRINAPAVIINKTESSEKLHNSLIPGLFDILKPVEAMHMVKIGDFTNPDVYTSDVITGYLDNILGDEENIGTSVLQTLYSTYNSADEKLKKWATERLTVLQRNKHKGNGQILYYRAQEKKYSFDYLFIEDDKDFCLWKKIFLEDGKIPDNLEEQKIEISKKYYPPYRNNNISTHKDTAWIPNYHNSNSPVYNDISKKSLPIKSLSKRLVETMLAGTLIFFVTIYISPIIAMIVGISTAIFIIKIIVDNERLS